MIILGIDPGLAIVGYGVIEVVKDKYTMLKYGVINTPKEDTVPVRLCKIADELERIIDLYAPDNIAVEELFFAANTKTAISVAQARGVILYKAMEKCGKLYEYTPLQIKQAVTGYGRADKVQVQTMVRILLNLTAVPRPDDAADALAVAICHGQTNKMSGLFSIG